MKNYSTSRQQAFPAKQCSVIHSPLAGSFGAWFTERLNILNVKPAAFAKQASVSRAAVYFWKCNRYPPTGTKWAALALLLGVTESEFAAWVGKTWPHAAKPSDGAGA